VGLGCAEFPGAGQEALHLRVALPGALPELVGEGADPGGCVGVRGVHDGPCLEEADLGDGALRQARSGCSPTAGLVVPLFLDDLEAERGAVGAGLDAGQEVAVVAGVEQVALEDGAVGVFAESSARQRTQGADGGVVAVVELDLHVGAGLAHRLGEGAADGPLEELALEHRVDLVPRVER
jgi:hypothetical protein